MLPAGVDTFVVRAADQSYAWMYYILARIWDAAPEAGVPTPQPTREDV